MPSTATKIFYKIGEACKELDIQPYVLRYWETEFPFLKPDKSKSGQRVYSAKDLGVIRRIKELLYEEGYTIAGAKKKLESEIEGGTTARGGGPGATFKQKAAARLIDVTSRSAEGKETAQGKDEEGEEAPLQRELGASTLDTATDERLETIARKLRTLRADAHRLLDRLRESSPVDP